MTAVLKTRQSLLRSFHSGPEMRGARIRDRERKGLHQTKKLNLKRSSRRSHSHEVCPPDKSLSDTMGVESRLPPCPSCATRRGADHSLCHEPTPVLKMHQPVLLGCQGPEMRNGDRDRERFYKHANIMLKKQTVHSHQVAPPPRPSFHLLRGMSHLPTTTREPCRCCEAAAPPAAEWLLVASPTGDGWGLHPSQRVRAKGSPEDLNQATTLCRMPPAQTPPAETAEAVPRAGRSSS